MFDFDALPRTFDIDGRQAVRLVGNTENGEWFAAVVAGNAVTVFTTTDGSFYPHDMVTRIDNTNSFEFDPARATSYGYTDLPTRYAEGAMHAMGAVRRDAHVWVNVDALATGAIGKTPMGQALVAAFINRVPASAVA